MSQSSILWSPPVTSHKIVSPLPSSPNTVTTTSYAAMQAYRSMLVGFLLLEVRPRMLNWSCGKSSNALRKYMARRKATSSATRQQKGTKQLRSNFLRRISYRPKRSSGDTAGGPARYEAPLLPACEAARGTREANNGMDVDSGFWEAPSLGHSQLVPRTTKTSPSSSNHVPPGQAALRADRPSESPTMHMRLDTPWRPARVLTISDGSVCDLSVSSRPPS